MTLLALPPPATDAELRARHLLGKPLPVDFAGRPQCEYCGCFGTPCLCDNDYVYQLPHRLTALLMRVSLRERVVRDRLEAVARDLSGRGFRWPDVLDALERHGFVVLDGKTGVDAYIEAGYR